MGKNRTTLAIHDPKMRPKTCRGLSLPSWSRGFDSVARSVDKAQVSRCAVWSVDSHQGAVRFFVPLRARWPLSRARRT